MVSTVSRQVLVAVGAYSSPGSGQTVRWNIDSVLASLSVKHCQATLPMRVHATNSNGGETLGSWEDFLPAELRRPRPQRATLSFLERNFTLTTWDWSAGRWWTGLTSAFSHKDPNHLLGNIISFREFSTSLIALGISPVRYMGLILGSAVASSTAYLLHARYGQRKSYQRTAVLGLSGVVIGLGAALACAMPYAKVRVLGLSPIPLPIYMLAYALYDAAMLGNVTSTTAHGAHIGGFLFGAAYYFSFLRGNLPLAPLLR